MKEKYRVDKPMFFRRQPKEAITYLGHKSEIQGDLYAEGDVCVEGVIHGKVEVNGDVEIAKTGLVEGTEIRACNLTIHGVAKAKITLEGRLTLSATARLEGDVKASALSIEPGAYYVGYITTEDTLETKALPASQTLSSNLYTFPASKSGSIANSLDSQL